MTAKADVLVADHRVHLLYAERADLWAAVVEGEHDVYLCQRSPVSDTCECPSTRRCSHLLAAEKVAYQALGDAA